MQSTQGKLYSLQLDLLCSLAGTRLSKRSKGDGLPRTVAVGEPSAAQAHARLKIACCHLAEPK